VKDQIKDRAIKNYEINIQWKTLTLFKPGTGVFYTNLIFNFSLKQ
jgi:hypothetical protein